MEVGLTYSVLLIVGMVLSQLPAIHHLKPGIAALTMSFLAYIVIQVGMEFEIDNTDLRKYGIVYLVAMASRSLSTAPCKLQGGNSVFLQSATYRTLPTYQKPIFFAVQQLALDLR